MEFVVAIAAVVSPTATRLAAQGRQGEVREIFLKWSKVAFTLSLLAGVFLIVLGPAFLARWIDPSFEAPAGRVLQILMASSLLFLPARGVALPVLMGLGRPRAATLAFLGAGALNLGLSVALARPFGLAGVAVGTAIPNVLFAVVALVLACREVGVAPAEYARYVIPRAVVGSLPALAVVTWFKLGWQVRDLTGLAAAGVATVTAFGLSCVFFVYRDDPYVDLRGQLVRLSPWRSRA
jgi:O-antigen/teichoic acid export membrane protein